MPTDDTPLFLYDPLRDLDALIADAQLRRASRLLILAGKNVVCRIAGKLSPPMHPERIHFRQTQSLAEALLTKEQQAQLNDAGALEIDYTPGKGSSPAHQVRLNVFFGDGAHNVVVFLE